MFCSRYILLYYVKSYLSVMHVDVVASFPLQSMLKFHKSTQIVKGHNITTVLGLKVCSC